ncbi:hypothetical protein PoB_004690600 [Plakobranchus ocellatus]|uniref:Uncharacterized protein n=1 Tax=Plakobranchus ocellatus TaxID=259542 RepID=A0AAV4BN08_9GAST|nr:hypothetical protein PoB_004690600 [Plakobranchus ocellatus]
MLANNRHSLKSEQPDQACYTLHLSFIFNVTLEKYLQESCSRPPKPRTVLYRSQTFQSRHDSPVTTSKVTFAAVGRGQDRVEADATC